MKYHIIETHHSSDLMDVVDQFIAEGWEPQGGVSVSVVHFVGCNGDPTTSETWAQAMVRK